MRIKFKNTFLRIVLGCLIVSCGSHKSTVYYQKQAPKKHPKLVVVIPKKEIDKAEKVFEVVKTEVVNPKQVTLDYINQFAPLAIIEMEKFNIPASITLAQGILESRSGQSELSLASNNHFGVKCHENWKGAYFIHDDEQKDECFRKYEHPMGSYQDHSLFLTSRDRYSFLFKLDKDDYKAWANGLKKAGYATDVSYPSKLIKIIEDYQLYRYDDEVLHLNKVHNNTVVDTVGDKIIRTADSITKNGNTFNNSIDLNTKTHIIVKGDTLYSLSKKYNVAIADLKRWNNLNSNDISIGQIVIIKCNC